MSEMSSRSGLGMESLGELRFYDYVKMLKRRRWWIGFVVVAITCATSMVALRLPSFYKSETTIQVDPQKVAGDLFPSPVTSSVADRLSIVRQQILSPNRLHMLIEQLGLFSDEIASRGEERILKRMQDSVSLDVLDTGGQRLGAFRVGYTAADPVVASRVANALAETIISENLRARKVQFSGTTDFLQGELADTKKQLEMKEAELGRIKSTYVADLPESKQYHLEALSNLRTQLQALQDRINNDQQQKVYLQSMSANSYPAVDADTESGGAASGSPEQAQIQKLEARLSELRARYGPSHPDVRRTQSELNSLKAKAAQEEREAAQTQMPAEPKPAEKPRRNPVLDAQMGKLDQEIADATKQVKAIQQQIDAHSGKLEMEPVFEQQIAGVMRDYDTLRAHYNRLLDKKLSAEMAEELDDRQKGERFIVLDAAPIPRLPSGPNRGLLMLAGLFGGLVGGIALALVLELTDESVRSEQEAVSIFGKSVLAGIPAIITRKDLVRGRVIRIAGLLGTATAAMAIGLAIVFLTGRIG